MNWPRRSRRMAGERDVKKTTQTFLQEQKTGGRRVHRLQHKALPFLKSQLTGKKGKATKTDSRKNKLHYTGEGHPGIRRKNMHWPRRGRDGIQKRF